MQGVLWRHYYRISAEPAGTLMVAVLQHDYIPKPQEITTDEEVNARLVRSGGEWDALITFVTDASIEPTHAARLSDDSIRSYLTKLAEELNKTAQARSPTRLELK